MYRNDSIPHTSVNKTGLVLMAFLKSPKDAKKGRKVSLFSINHTNKAKIVIIEYGTYNKN